MVFTLFKVGFPTCCPSSMILASFKLVDDALVKQTECRYTPQGNDYTIVRAPCTGLGTSGPPAPGQLAPAPGAPAPVASGGAQAGAPAPVAIATPPGSGAPIAADPSEQASAPDDAQAQPVAIATPPAANAAPPDASAAPPVAVGGGVGVSEVLTDSVQSDILRAITRANNAWARANEFLDSSTLNGNVAGQALSDDLAQVDKLRAQGHVERDHESAFNVVDVSLDAPGHAVVHTHETWYDETYDSSDRAFLSRSASTSYAETYLLEYQNGLWTVTRNDLN
jgi:hypothetical protein